MELMKNDEIDRIVYGLNEKNISESAQKIQEKAGFDEAFAKSLLNCESEKEFLLNLCHCFINKIDSLEAANKKAGRHRKYVLEEDEVYSLHEQGYSCRRIAEDTGIPFATVSRMIRRKKKLLEIKKRIAEHERELEYAKRIKIENDTHALPDAVQPSWTAPRRCLGWPHTDDTRPL